MSQSYSNQIVQTVWYYKHKAYMFQKFTFGLALDKLQGMAIHQGVLVHSLQYTEKTNIVSVICCYIKQLESIIKDIKIMIDKRSDECTLKSL